MFGNQSEQRAHVREDDGAAEAKGARGKNKKERGKKQSVAVQRDGQTRAMIKVCSRNMCAGTGERRLRGLVVGCTLAGGEGEEEEEDRGGGGASRGSQQGGVTRQMLAPSPAALLTPFPRGPRGARSSKRECQSA